ncbi:medium-chain fatty acid-CoA ligase faa2 [Dipsacomyces acuminosporus]|nr:medium-chain fatty acid-CoA ligase faa2 [Dipsacomyces acuminosporus]
MKSFLVPDSAQPGYSTIVRHPDYRDGKNPDKHAHITTIYELFQHYVTRSPEHPFLGSRQYDTGARAFGPYTWKTGEAVQTWVDSFGSGLDHVYSKHVVSPTASLFQQPLGIYTINRPEWLVAELGGFRSRRFSVALYDTLGADSIEYIINHAEIQVLVCSIDKIPKLLAIRDKLPELKVIISMDSFDDHGENPATLPFTVSSINVLHKWAESKSIVLLDMKQVSEMGASIPTPPSPPASSDLCTICYTSGTTGNPKGAMSSHANYIFTAKVIQAATNIHSPVHFSFLPLAHCFERSTIYAAILASGSIGFYSGDMLSILSDAQELRPTLMIVVPRLLNRVYDRISTATIYAPGLKGALARMAVSKKLKNLSDGYGNKHALWDRVFFNKIAQLFGGRLENMFSGSAPLDPDVLSFLRIAFGCNIQEGFGMTESSACATASVSGENKGGHVGAPMPGVDIRLRDVPEMSYLTTDTPCPRGEILVKGRNVFLGYYKNEEKTDEAFDDGWLITGDIGQLNNDGTLSIVDRRKNIFKLSQGEYIAPERLEVVYGRHNLVMNIFVYGDSLKSELVAVVVPDPETFVPWAQKITSNPVATLEELIKNRNAVGALLVELEKHGRESKLQGFEIIRNIHCDSVPFDIENNCLLTTTLKLKRNVATSFYRKQLDELYRQINGSSA